MGSGLASSKVSLKKFHLLVTGLKLRASLSFSLTRSFSSANACPLIYISRIPPFRIEGLCAPQICMLKPWPPTTTIRRWHLSEVIRMIWSPEGRALMMSPRGLLPLNCSLCYVWTRGEVRRLQSAKGSSPDRQDCEKYRPPGLWVTCCSHPSWLRHLPSRAPP